ncbi:MAG: hypothetical protein GF401_04920, partial [Chitinivibrionales bacterium]|nr:hypothetical protein [Chitinivibrionales bacterium]
MNTYKKIINGTVNKFKQEMVEFCNDFDFSHLMPELAEQMSQKLKESLAEAGKAGYSDYIESFDCDKPTISKDGHIMRKKGKVSKSYLTCFGEITIHRSLYQADRGGKSFVPLEEHWGMQGQYATVDV